MASFGPETAVLRFRLPRVEWVGHPQWLLWPCWAWRVVAPQPAPRRLNVFQKAVLGLCHAGTHEAKRIGDRLMIGAELAAHVLVELQGRGWLDHRGRPTEGGQRIWEAEAEEAPGAACVGWAFTDPFSGETWPRFRIGTLPLCDVEVDADGRRALLSGTHGKPRRDAAYAVRPRGANHHVHRPRAEDVLRAIRAQQRQVAFGDENVEETDAPLLHRVHFISEEPTDFYLALRVWRDGTGQWLADDPFGLGASTRVRRWVEQRLDDEPGLRKWLAPVAGGDVTDESIAELRRRAEWDVEERLTSAIRRRPDLHERLVVARRAWLEAEVDGSPVDKWDDVAVKSQRAAELLLQQIAGEFPTNVRLARHAQQLNADLFDAIAGGLGFDAPLPRTLSRVKPGKVQAAQEAGDGSLRPMLLLTLLGTRDAPDHPLRGAAARAPDLLRRLDALASVRDASAHEKIRGRRPSPDVLQARVIEGAKTLFDAVELLSLDRN